MDQMKRTEQICRVMLCTSLLAGCATKKQESSLSSITAITDEEELTATVRILVNEDYGDWLKDTLDDFSKIHTKWDLTFETEVADSAEMMKQQADVYIYENEDMDDMADQGLIAELGGDTLDNASDNQPQSVFDSLLYNGEMYGTCLKSETTLLYYDTSIFAESDVKDLDDMLEKGKVGIPFSNGETLLSFYLSNGCTLYGSDQSSLASGVSFSGENALAVTKYLMDLVKNKNFVDVGDEGISALKEGKVNALFASSDSYEEIKEVLSENYGVCALPTYTLSKNKLQLKSFVRSTVASVNASSENLQVACALVGYLSGVQAQSGLQEEYGYLASHTSISNSDDVTLSAFQDALASTSLNRPIFDAMDTVTLSASDMASELTQNIITDENASEKTESMNAAMNIRQ